MSTTAVYNTYRSVVRKARANSENSRNSRSGERKQRALKIAADRYRMPISQVKQIVREMDAANGITHEHTASYQEKLDVLAAGNALGNPEDAQCTASIHADYSDEERNTYAEEAGWDTTKPAIHHDPYQIEVYGKKELIFVCGMCYTLLAEYV